MSDASYRHIVAVAVVVRRGERMLALRRAATKDAGPGLWEAVSGRIEIDENPLDAAAREVQEETGLEVVVDPRPITAYEARRIGEPMIVIVYGADHVAGEVRLSDEHDDFAWLTVDAFATRSTLERLVAAARIALGRTGS